MHAEELLGRIGALERHAVREVSTSQTLLSVDETIVVTASGKTLTLPSLDAIRTGQSLTIIQGVAGVVTIAPNTGNSILGV